MIRKKFNVVGIGELLWDVLPDSKELGGAPANFTYHANYLGANSTIISAVGDDELGEEILLLLKERNLKYTINIVEYPTGEVSVQLDNGIPNYVIHENVAWDFIKLKKEAISILKKADAICFGTLSQRSKESFKTIQKALNLVPATALKIFDVNFRQSYYSKNIIENSIKYANVLKLNDEELIILSNMFNLPNSQDEACKKLFNLFDLKLLALTNGLKGSVLFNQKEISRYSVPKVVVVDTIGAGDSFTAALVVGMLKGKSLEQIHKDANEHAAKVCMYRGATPTF